MAFQVQGLGVRGSGLERKWVRVYRGVLYPKDQDPHSNPRTKAAFGAGKSTQAGRSLGCGVQVLKQGSRKSPFRTPTAAACYLLGTVGI